MKASLFICNKYSDLNIFTASYDGQMIDRVIQCDYIIYNDIQYNRVYYYVLHAIDLKTFKHQSIMEYYDMIIIIIIID